MKKTEISQRLKEVDRILNLCEYSSMAAAQIEYSKADNSKARIKFSAEYSKNLKGLAFLAMYNVLEGVVVELLQESFLKLNSLSPKYENATDSARAVWIRYRHDDFKKDKGGAIVSKIRTLGSEQISISDKQDADGLKTGYKAYLSSIGKNNEISGNIDVRKVREIFTLYGIAHSDPSDPSQILTIKTNRNKLAHGEETLSMVGRCYTTSDLRKMRDQVSEYLELCCDAVNHFVKHNKWVK